MEKDLICRFTEILGQLRALHWQTESYARHIAYEKTYNALEIHIDAFVESYQGKYGRVKIISQPKLLNVNEDINGFIEDSLSFLIRDIPSYMGDEGTADPGLCALRDEMVNELNILKYLLTLK